jgi:aconitate hydratase
MHDTKTTLSVNGRDYLIYSLRRAKEQGFADIDVLPKSLKVLLENQLRNQNGQNVTWADVQAINDWTKERRSEREISYYPARVIMQDFTGVPAMVDLAAMRDAMKALGGDPQRINPLTQVDLVIDHSVTVEHFGFKGAFEKNVEREYERNKERYSFLKWGQKAFRNFRVVPPGTGIVHQVNLEYLADVVCGRDINGELTAYPDTCVGTDSHTTMINGLSVLGWGVGGIEAEAAMLGQPVTMLIPEVVGFRLTGELGEGVTATDLVLTVTEMLRKRGVVGKFVEFFGTGLENLPIADRATLANMAPEYGATVGFFPIDEKTIDYLKFTGRDERTVALVEAYAREQTLWISGPEPVFSDVLELDLKTVVSSIAGPKRPQDRIELSGAANGFEKDLHNVFKTGAPRRQPVENADYTTGDGDVVIAAITSCTNTSNPTVLMAAGLLAKKAVEKGLTTKPWVKTSLAPGSQVVTDYLEASGLQPYLDQLGFYLVGYGCTTCIGNSGPLPGPISTAIHEGNLVAAAVLSGNRNFEGRVHPEVRANYLASPPLVVAYALAGTMLKDMTREPIGYDREGNGVFLDDIWPSQADIETAIRSHLTSKMFRARYADVFEGDSRWKGFPISEGEIFDWDPESTYIRNPPFFDHLKEGEKESFSIKDANILALLGDSVTTDHISPAGAIAPDGPAAGYLTGHGVARKDWNSFGSRRGNHEVMMRGTFANIRIKNEMVPGVEGGFTRHVPTGEQLGIFDAAMRYRSENRPLIVIAGKEYGTGSSRDWAAKGTSLLGVKAVIVESFERIHRSNLIGMGVLPLQFETGVTRKTLGLTGEESLSIKPLSGLRPKMKFRVTVKSKDGSAGSFDVLCRLDTQTEVIYFKHGGILPYVLRRLNK